MCYCLNSRPFLFARLLLFFLQLFSIWTSFVRHFIFNFCLMRGIILNLLTFCFISFILYITYLYFFLFPFLFLIIIIFFFEWAISLFSSFYTDIMNQNILSIDTPPYWLRVKIQKIPCF